MFPFEHVPWVLTNHLIFFFTLRTQVLDVTWGQPQTTTTAIGAFWDAVSDKGVLALFLSFQPGRYQSSREELVQMIGLGDSEGSHANYGNGRCKLLVNNLAHLSLKRVWNSVFYLNEIQMCFWSQPSLSIPARLRPWEAGSVLGSLVPCPLYHVGIKAEYLAPFASRLAQEKYPSAP